MGDNMFCDTESLAQFYAECNAYVDTHTEYFYKMIETIDDSPLLRKICETKDPTAPAQPVLVDWNFSSWTTSRWLELFAERTRAHGTKEFKDSFDEWQKMSSELLAPIRIVLNMITIMSLTFRGIPDAVYQKLGSRRCLECMLYISLRSYVSLSSIPRYTEWAYKRADGAFFRLDPQRVQEILLNTMFAHLRYGSATTALPRCCVRPVNYVSSPYTEAVEGIHGWFQIMRAPIITQTWSSYIRTDAVRSSLLVHPEGLFFRSRLLQWAQHKVDSGRSMTMAAWLSLTNATGREGVKTFSVSMEEEEQDTLAIEAMNRLEEIKMDEGVNEPWQSMLSRILADFLVPTESVLLKRPRTK